MGWLLRHNWLWALLAFLLGAVITWFLLSRRERPPAAEPEQAEEPAEEKVLVGAGVGATGVGAAGVGAAGVGAAGATQARTTPGGGAPASPRPDPAPSRGEPVEPFDQEQPGPLAVPAAGREVQPEPEVRPEPGREVRPQAESEVPAAQPAFSRRMDADREPAEPALFGDPGPPAPDVAEDRVPPGRYGEGSADAVPHQGPPDGFTIKGNAQSMLFHTPDSPYYGRTKPQVWFRTEADAERAGFTKYTRKPRKSPIPRD